MTILLLQAILFISSIILVGIAAKNVTLGIHERYAKALIKIFEYVTSFNKGETVQDKRDVFSKEKETRALRQRYYRAFSLQTHQFRLGDVITFATKCLDAIINDKVTESFRSHDDIEIWNLLTRNYSVLDVSSYRVRILWFLGFIFRYGVLFPVRFLFFIVAVSWMTIGTNGVRLVPENFIIPKATISKYITLILFRIMSRTFSVIAKFHNPENMAKPNSICVANHTSPIDVAILCTQNCFTLVGQIQGGFFGMVERSLSEVGDHIWFERSQASDRMQVTELMHKHLSKPGSSPILIFPEGTCINNTSVLMFRKGSFEMGVPIYPVAIKYDPRLGEAFWDSSKYGFLHYLCRMMTSWAIKVDVYYLPPMSIFPNETSVEFASRVKSVIAEKGGFVDIDWDGQLKRTLPKAEYKKTQQLLYSQTLIK